MLHKNNKKTHKKAKQFPNNTTQRMNFFLKPTFPNQLPHKKKGLHNSYNCTALIIFIEAIGVNWLLQYRFILMYFCNSSALMI